MSRRTITICVATAALLALGGAAASPAVAACENEALRTEMGWGELPDCRGYEMVSPPYTEGYPLLPSAISPAGDKVILQGLGNINAAGSDESYLTGSTYLASRTPSGWHTSALTPPASEFVGEAITPAVNPGTGETLWRLHSPAESLSKLGLYARSLTASPALRFIGPLNIPYEGEPTNPSNATDLTSEHLTEPVAATGDYGHVIVTSGKYHWPFDTTGFGSFSLYEFSGTQNVHDPHPPIPVGVTGEEKGSADLIAQCGTLLGGGSGSSSYNALSSNGEVVFFTVNRCSGNPQRAEVYARINGALSEPGPARTVEVSASECTGGGSECADESGMNFEGASEDGRRVFFTSTQKLTNNAVDGTSSGNANREEGEGCDEATSGPGCNLYQYRFNVTSGAEPHLTHGALHLVAGGGVLGVSGVAEDGSRIYFVSRSAIPSTGTSELGKPPEVGQPNLYVYDARTEATSFVATLGGGDARVWRTALWQRTAEVGGEGGQYVLFESGSDLTPDDTSTATQLFEYDAETKELVRLSKGEAGYNEDGNVVAVGVEQTMFNESNLHHGGLGVDFKTAAYRLNVSADGHTVVFETGGRLSPRAVSAEAKSAEGFGVGEGVPCMSVYEFHSGGALSAGTLHLVSDGRETEESHVGCGPEEPLVDASGANILFPALDSLVPTDVDGGQRSMYDARIGGGVDGPAGPGTCGGGCGVSAGDAEHSGLPATAGSALAGQATPIAPLAGKHSLGGNASHNRHKRGHQRRTRRRRHRAHGTSRASAHGAGG